MSSAQPVIPEIIGRNEEVLRAQEPSRPEPVDASVSIPARLQNTTVIVLGGLLLLMPICFGAVHPKSYLSAEILIFALTVVYLIGGGASVVDAFSREQGRFTSRLVLFSLGTVLLYSVLQTLVLSMQHLSHPLLGTTSGLLNEQQTITSLRQVGFFLCVYVLARALFSTSAGMAHRFVNLCMLVGVVVAGIALSHWFYDHGLLFWTFAPDSVVSHSRARWPFVNPNHLAHFLLPVIFLVIGRITEQVYALRELRESKGATRESFFSLFLVSRTFQRKVFQISLLVVVALGVSVAIVGSQSRGSWLGLSLCILAFLFCLRLIPSPARAVPSPHSSEHLRHSSANSGDRHHRNRDREQTLRLLSSVLSGMTKPFLILGALGLLLFFLNEQGSELLAERINYGLMHAKDDLRWQLYVDTLPIFYGHPFFGIGLGAWASAYPQFMNQLLAGINPEYLHSDPYQALVELGIVGILPFVFLVMMLVVRVVQRLRSGRPEEGIRVLGLSCGLLALLVASFLDFPFRIPAIGFMVATYLALTTFYLDRTPRSSKSNFCKV